MADISKIERKGVVYNVKDAIARSGLQLKYTKPIAGIPIEDLSDEIKHLLQLAGTALQHFSETDPTVPSWAKQPEKPVYTASEIGALPDTTHIPADPVNPDWNASSGLALILNKPTLFSGNYNDLTNKPSIPSAYDDTALSGRVTTLENAGFLTTETDPTVPAWAKASSKPTYTASEVGALPSTTHIPVDPVNADWNSNSGLSQILNKPTIPIIPTNISAFNNDVGYLTSFTETDPTVPAWAKESSKPTYTASEVGALPDTTVIPPALSAGNGINIDSNAIKTTGIPFGICDSTSTSTAYTVTVPGIYKLEDGVCCLVKNNVVTSESGFTLNVNGLGAKPSYSNMATGNPITPTNPTRDTTIFNINYAMLFIYSSTIVEGGGWICYRGYDANTNTIGYQVRSNSYSLPATHKFYRYRLLFTSADGSHFVPANTSTSTNATSSRTVNQEPIDPFGTIAYYGTTAAVETNARPAASSLWILYTLNLGYSFNRTGAALTLTTWAPVYVKCAPQTDGSAIIDSTTPYVQALPTTDDGNIYIFLGVAYSATNIELSITHPVYYHDGAGIRLWTGARYYTKAEVDALLGLIS